MKGIGQVDINGKPIKKELTKSHLMMQQSSPSSPDHPLHECIEIKMMMLQWISVSLPFTLEMPSIYRIGRLNHHGLFWDVVEDMTP
jgi:hypothetical protein